MRRILSLLLALGLSASAQSLDDARRNATRPMDVSTSLDLLARTLAAHDDDAVRIRLLLGMRQGLDGRRNVPAPAHWAAVSGTLSTSTNKEVRQLTEDLNRIFGNEAAIQSALATLQNKKAPVESRRSALASLVTQRHPKLAAIIPKLLAEEPLRLDAIRACSSTETPDAPKRLLALYPKVSQDHQRAIVETLSTRKTYAEALFQSIQDGRVKRTAVPAYVSRSLATILGKRYTDVFGTGALTGGKEALIAKYKKLLTPADLAKANASHGRTVYQRTCQVCHLMFGEGTTVGPDLTGSNRANLDYILLNILDPSGDIPDAYRLNIVTTTTKQVVSGTVVAEDDAKLVLNVFGRHTTILKSDIAKRDTPKVSMMPEGLLATLNDNEIRDLIKYLQSPVQVDLPK